MSLHAPPFGQARCGNQEGRIVPPQRRIDRIGGKPIAMIFLQHARVRGAIENFDAAIARAMGEATQTAAKGALQPRKAPCASSLSVTASRLSPTTSSKAPLIGGILKAYKIHQVEQHVGWTKQIRKMHKTVLLDDASPRPRIQ